MKKEELEFLQRDRKVNKTFVQKLEKVGFEVVYDKYDFWDNQEKIIIGDANVWLVESYYTGNGTSCRFRKQNDVVREIKYTIKEQKEELKKEDKNVNDFFNKLYGCA